METTAAKRRIAILGGGVAALTTAFEITSAPDWREKYEVTIYQMGWRLGGKCATGRGVFDRIEEHGIHAFSGCYFNALGVMADCYAELGQIMSEGVLPSFGRAFRPSDTVVMWEMVEGALRPWPLQVADNTMRLVDPADPAKPIDRAKAIAEGVAVVEASRDIGQLFYEDCVAPSDGWAGRSGTPVKGLADLWRRFVWAIRFAAWALRRGAEVGAFRQLLARTGVSASLSATLGAFLFKSSIPLSEKFRRGGVMFNYVASLWRGIFTREYNVFPDGVEILDRYNFYDWLISHGLDSQNMGSPLVFNTIDLSYNYPDGDNSQKPDMAAGTYLRWSLRMFAPVQAFAWSFEAGTGETVIAPLYHVLKHRGVRFEFFHKVRALELSEDRRQVGRIQIDVQATLRDPEAGYDPLIEVPCGAGASTASLLCWPNHPRYEQLVEGEAMSDPVKAYDLESYWCDWPIPQHKTLTVGRDFDHVVFAISIGAVPFLCRDILDAADPPQREAWRAMIAGVPVCATQTMQIWLDDTSSALGADGLLDTAEQRLSPIISGTFIAPLNGQADFSHLLAYEGWGRPQWGVDAPPRSLWYFTGALALTSQARSDFTDAAVPEVQRQRVRDFSVQALMAAGGYLLPRGVTDWAPLALDFQHLQTQAHPDWADPAVREATILEPHPLDPEAIGAARFDNQFWRANIDPTECYVQAPHGGTTLRLAADGSGFDNLTLAGDWIRNGLNVGSVEGTVMGAKLAAHAVCGWPLMKDIYCYRPPSTAAGVGRSVKPS